MMNRLTGHAPRRDELRESHSPEVRASCNSALRTGRFMGRVLEGRVRENEPFPFCLRRTVSGTIGDGASFDTRHSTFVILLAFFACLGSVALQAATPPNDRFANRILISGTNVTVTGWSTNATKEGGEPDHAGNAGGKSVWWTWTAPTNGEVRISTDGSTFDTLLGVYTGTERVSSLSLVASNDDHGLPGVGVSSRVKFNTSPNTSYQIAVDGYSDGTQADSGDVVLNLAFFSEPIPRPANDNFTNRITLSGLPVTATGSNQWATHEVAEPYHAERFGDTSVWWTWTAPTSGWVRVSTVGSAFDTLLAVYQGTALTNLNVVATSDDIDPLEGLLASALAFEALSNQTYQIAVDGFDGAYGAVVLSLEDAAPRLRSPVWLPEAGFRFILNGLPGLTYDIQASTNLVQWSTMGSVQTVEGTAVFTDSTATNRGARFYQAVQQP